jgi:Flp pilus assembly protein TadD
MGMNNFICHLPVKFIAFVILLEALSAMAIAAMAVDYPAWTYYDLDLTAQQMKTDGNYYAALTLLNLAISIEPDEAKGYISRGAIYGILHENAKGIQDELKGLALVKNNTDRDTENKWQAHQYLAAIYLNDEHSAEAEQELKMAVQLCPNNPLTAERFATLLIKNKKTEQGLKYFKKAKECYEKSQLMALRR